MNPSEKAAFVESWALFCLVQLLIGIEAMDGFLVICSGKGFKSRNADNIEITSGIHPYLWRNIFFSKVFF